MKSFSIKSEAFIWMELKRIMLHYMAICSPWHSDFLLKSKLEKSASLCSRVEWHAAYMARSFCLMQFTIAIMQITDWLYLHQLQTVVGTTSVSYTHLRAHETDSYL